MNSLLKRASLPDSFTCEKYRVFNLTENPFPSTPFTSQGKSDKRYNGDIYEETIRQKEYNQIEQVFLKAPQSDPNHFRIGYIEDTSYVGRGNGKSSFAINLLKKINNAYCSDITNEENKCFGLYITPEVSGRTRSFGNFIDLIAYAIFESNIVEYSLASLRLSAIIELDLFHFEEDDLKDEVKVIDDMNNIEWFNKNKIYLGDIHSYLLKNNFFKAVNSEFPLQKITWSKFDKSNITIITKRELISYYKGIKKDNEKMQFIFDDLVQIFLASGFNGAYLIVDDFERIPDFQSDRQKRDFAMELRTNFFDGSNANAQIGFFNLLLMLHAGVIRLVEKAWSDSGMEQRSPLTTINQELTHVISFDKLSSNHAILLVKKYLSEYRINPNDTLEPFTRDAIIRIGEVNDYNAAKILKLSYLLIESAANESITEINIDFVNKILQKEAAEVETTKTTIIDENSEDLLKKARR